LSLILEKNAQRLLVHPSFDKLWLDILGFFGNVLSCRHISQDATRLSTYRQYFVDLYCLFDKSGVFNDKPELLNITQQSLQTD